MVLFGHPRIYSEKLYHINSIEAVKHTPANSCVLFTYDEEVFELIKYAKENAIDFALKISNITEAIICENLDAKYLLVEKSISSTLQKIADNYLFDAKILVHIENETQIEDLALDGIDGAIFSEAIIKIS